MHTQHSTIEITLTNRPGVFEFRLPFRRVDEGHLKLMADLLEMNFSCSVVIVDASPTGPEMPADWNNVACSCCNAFEND